MPSISSARSAMFIATPPPRRCALAAMFLTILVYQFRLERMRLLHERELKEATRRSVDQSRSTLKGQMAEQMAPFLAGFEYLPADARFLGDPVDYVVFQGRTE